MLTVYWAVALFVLAALIIYLYFERYTLRVRKYTIPVRNLPEGFHGYTILHLTDLHGKRFGRRQARLIRLIRNLNYHVVVLTGDLVNKFWPDIKPAMELVKKLTGRPVYFVPGNHEWVTGFKAKEPLAQFGVRIIDNKAEKLFQDGSHIWIVGVDDPHLGRDRLDQAVAAVDDSAPRVLLAHSPGIFPRAVRNQIDLVIVGHTHGGQVRIPFLGALVVPGQGLFPRWDYGIYKTGRTTMVISCGLGESDLPIRFNIKPEVVLITLVNAKGKFS